MSDDPRLEAARYRSRRDDDGSADEARSGSGSGGGSGTPTPHDRALYVETAIQQAIRRGEFDDLPGAGKPLEGLGDHHDPDWWIRRKIQTEGLTGLGPPAFMLRTEHAEFDARLDALTTAASVREYVEDFNLRVVAARRQLQGGPPVVTPTRDADAEVAAWSARRAERTASAAAEVSEEVPRRRFPWPLRARRDA